MIRPLGKHINGPQAAVWPVVLLRLKDLPRVAMENNSSQQRRTKTNAQARASNHECIVTREWKRKNRGACPTCDAKSNGNEGPENVRLALWLA